MLWQPRRKKTEGAFARFAPNFVEKISFNLQNKPGIFPRKNFFKKILKKLLHMCDFRVYIYVSIFPVVLQTPVQ